MSWRKTWSNYAAYERVSAYSYVLGVMGNYIASFTFQVSVQNSKRMKISESEKDLSCVSDCNSLRERAVFLKKAGNRTPGHPLDEHVDRVALLNGAEHSNDVSEEIKCS